MQSFVYFLSALLLIHFCNLEVVNYEKKVVKGVHKTCETYKFCKELSIFKRRLSGVDYHTLIVKTEITEEGLHEELDIGGLISYEKMADVFLGNHNKNK